MKMKYIIYTDKQRGEYGYKFYLHTFHNCEIVTIMNANKAIKFDDKLNADNFIKDNGLINFKSEPVI